MMAGLTVVALAAAMIGGWRISSALPFSLAIGSAIFSGWNAEAGSPLPLSRVLLVIGVVVMLARAADARDEWRLQWRSIHSLMYAAVAFAVVSAAVAGTLNQPAANYALLDKFGIVPFVLFAIAPHVFVTRRDRNILLVTLVVVGAYLAVTAILEGFGALDVVWPGYIADQALGIHQERARGPFLEATTNGLSLFVCAVAAWIGARTWLRPGAQCVALVVGVACVMATVATVTRSIWLGTALGVTVLALGDGRTRRWLTSALPVLIGIALAAYVFVPGLAETSGERASSERPLWDRVNSNRAALEAWREQPLLGVGWGRFPAAHQNAFLQADTIPLTGSQIEVHNVFLANLTELGMLGAGLWVVVLVSAIGLAVARRCPEHLRLWRLGLGAIFLQWLVVASFAPLSGAFPNMVLWTFAGIVSAAAVQPRSGVFPARPIVRTRAAVFERGQA